MPYNMYGVRILPILIIILSFSYEIQLMDPIIRKGVGKFIMQVSRL